MGRREGTTDARVSVAVSSAMAQLRRTQGLLNGFWQTSELAYGYLLSQSASLAANPDRPTFELLGHLESVVWFPTNQGRIKRADTIGNTLRQVRENTVHAYRTTLLSFYSAFEAYLEVEATPVRQGQRWGPFVRSLSGEKLRHGYFPLPLRTVLCADFSRLVRNKMTHQNFSVPMALDDAEVLDWKVRLETAAVDAGWPAKEVRSEVAYAASQVVGQAVGHVRDAMAGGKELPIELFYMLFNFTNLDSLAFAVEEALQPIGSRPGFEVSRKEAAVNRDDLILRTDR